MTEQDSWPDSLSQEVADVPYPAHRTIALEREKADLEACLNAQGAELQSLRERNALLEKVAEAGAELRAARLAREQEAMPPVGSPPANMAAHLDRAIRANAALDAALSALGETPNG